MPPRWYNSADFEESITRVLYRGGAVEVDCDFEDRKEGWLAATFATTTDAEEPDSREISIVLNAEDGDKNAVDSVWRQVREYQRKFQTDLEMRDVILPAIRRMAHLGISDATVRECENFRVSRSDC